MRCTNFQNYWIPLGSISGPPEKLRARVVVEVDTPSASDALALVDLHASVGTIRLHVPSDMEVHLFSSMSKKKLLENASQLKFELGS